MRDEIKNTRIAKICLIYSLSIFWGVLGYDVIYSFISNYLKMPVHTDLFLGRSVFLIKIMFIIFSILIYIPKNKIAKFLFGLIYLGFTSYILLPQHPYKWIYLSLGNLIFLFIINIVIEKLEKNKLFYILFTIILFSISFILLCLFRNIFHTDILFLTKNILYYIVCGNILIVIIYNLFSFIKDRKI